MSQCTNLAYRDMLHAWELDMLSEEDRERLGVHLLECDACAEEAGAFSEAARLLRSDPDFRLSADELSVTGMSNQREASIFRNRLTRVLLAAALVVIVAIPIFRMLFSSGRVPEPGQRITLAPVRGSEDAVVDRSRGGRVEIAFYVEGAGKDTECRVRVMTSRDSVIFANDRYRGFSTSGSGRIILPVDLFPLGVCTMVIYPSNDSASLPQRYHFRVK